MLRVYWTSNMQVRTWGEEAIRWDEKILPIILRHEKITCIPPSLATDRFYASIWNYWGNGRLPQQA